MSPEHEIRVVLALERVADALDKLAGISASVVASNDASTVAAMRHFTTDLDYAVTVDVMAGLLREVVDAPTFEGAEDWTRRVRLALGVE